MTNFDFAFGFSIKHEGGFVDHELDRGGATKYGITINTLSKWRQKEVTIDDVRDLSLEEAKNIYRAWYFNPLKLDQCYNAVTSTIIFDQAINRGTHTVAKEIQFLLGVKQDGIIGPKSLQALNEVNQKEFQIEFFKVSQLSYVNIVQNRPNQTVFLKGWINRTHEILSLIEYGF